MRKNRHLALDGQSLQLLLTIYDTGSVTGAAKALDINQSSASHGLEKLRQIFGDPLFVKSGRGIVPTDYVEQLIPDARTLLSSMINLFEADDYDPEMETSPLVIATNSYLRDAIVRRIFSARSKEKVTASFEFMDIGHGRGLEDILTRNDADLAIAVARTEYPEFLRHQKILEDHFAVYFDGSCRSAPNTLEKYRAAAHAVVGFGSTDDSLIDMALKLKRVWRYKALKVPTMEALPRLIKGTDLVATMPSRFSQSVFADFDCCEAPMEVPPFSVNMVWHVRSHNSPRNRWIRNLVQSALREQNESLAA